MKKITYIADRLVRHTKKTYPRRRLDQIRGIAIHHSAGKGGPEAMARWHVIHKDWAGIGYPFVIVGGTGPSAIYQTADLDRATYHVGKLHNRSRIGIVIRGDFDAGHPHPNDLHAAAWLCGLLCEALDLGDPLDSTGPWKLPGHVVAGHRELWGSSTKIGKTCPGRRFSLDAFRRLASEAYRDRFAAGGGWDAIRKSGIEIPFS